MGLFMQNLYRILGVPKDADQESIKKAYKKLVRKYHPDVNSAPEAAERFQEVKKAYEVLGSVEDRKMYDHYGDLMFKEGFHAASPENDGWEDSSMGSHESSCGQPAYRQMSAMTFDRELCDKGVWKRCVDIMSISRV